MAALRVTKGRPVRMYCAKLSLRRRASASRIPTVDFDSGGAQLLETFSRDQRVGVFHAADDARDSGGDDGVGAGTGASGVRAGFQIEVERVAARQRAGLLPWPGSRRASVRRRGACRCPRCARAHRPRRRLPADWARRDPCRARPVPAPGGETVRRWRSPWLRRTANRRSRPR